MAAEESVGQQHFGVQAPCTEHRIRMLNELQNNGSLRMRVGYGRIEAMVKKNQRSHLRTLLTGESILVE